MIKTGSDFLIGPEVEINGLVNALGTGHRSAALQMIVVANETERQTVSLTRWEQELRSGAPLRASKTLPNQRSVP